MALLVMRAPYSFFRALGSRGPISNERATPPSRKHPACRATIPSRRLERAVNSQAPLRGRHFQPRLAAMSIEAQLNDLLKEAMRAKDAETANCIRMIKTKHMERRTAAGFKGPLDDALWLDVIATYQKQLRKSREEYVAIGARGAEAIPQI